MKFLKNLRFTRSLSFRKSWLNIAGNNYAYDYKIITDAGLITIAKKIADETHCELLSIGEHRWKTDGKIIILKSTKENYINFCTNFCKELGKYIDDIEFDGGVI